MRHADAGYEEAIDSARGHGLRLPGFLGRVGFRPPSACSEEQTTGAEW